jgi:predicted transposase/invertase (TIGR01784 family)
MNKKLIRFDWAVKKLLRNKANFVVLEGFLSELLFDGIRIEKILESEGNQETEDDKCNRVDIVTQNSKNELIIIEIQNTYEIDYFQRMAFGGSTVLIKKF